MPRRVDIHHHIFPPGVNKAALSAAVGFKTPPENLPWTPELSLAAMDRLGIDVAVLSYPANIPAGPASPQSRAAAREYNEFAARVCAAHPGRFAFFAVMPNLFDAQGGVEEIRYALDELKAVGVSLPSSYGEGADARYIADDQFDPVWEELHERSAVVFLHGAQTPSSTPYPHPCLGIPITEVPNETYKAAAHLVVSGKKRRFSNAKVILAHLGGSVPMLAPRVAEVLEDFASFYFDMAISASETTLTAMEAFADDGRVLFGTDFPGAVRSFQAVSGPH
ncbi:uncharacterized protein BXZ73DRAFT_87792 [Epithele typhae]|uniref:uncharacterized protein n=1 Tax=Epithele typhae TaxID=378194 RepID=UPI00200753E2|nr:uncharacterized protein BXZ73DRAFT_87792 [Epithele typhae]KAH9943473.1 hypothetical protein BXZ73DRAFT_87792 [Epithele typhae]